MRLILFLLAAMAAPAVAAAQAVDPVVAKVGDVLIHRSEVEREATQLAPTMRGATPQVILQVARERVIEMYLMLAVAEAEGLDRRLEFQRELAARRRSLLSQYYMVEYLKPFEDEARVRALYDETYPEGKGKLQMRASHILLADEAAARDIIRQLDEGAEFAALATRHSIGPSKAKGGELPPFGMGAMVAPFQDAVLALEPGQYSREPVQTQFGWHVILVHEKARPDAPPFEQARQALSRQLRERLLQEHIEELRTQTAVERYDAEGRKQ